MSIEISSKSEIEEEKLESSPDAESPVEQSLSSPLDGKQEAKKESTISPIPDEELTFAPDEVRTDTHEVSQPDVPEITAPGQEQENQEEQTPPPLPQNTEDQEPVIMDHHYLEELRNKRYEFGANSLTEKEKAALAQDLKVNAGSRQKELVKNQDFVKKAGRFFLGIVLMSFSLNSCTKGNSTFGMILLGISTYLLFPYIKKILDEQA